MNEKVSNIRLKDESTAKLKVISAFRKIYGKPMDETVRLIDNILEVKEVIARNSAPTDEFQAMVDYNYAMRDKLGVDDLWMLVRYIKDHFDCDWEDLDPYHRPSNENIREPDEATKEALAWRETLSEKEQEMIKLIADWENPVCITAVC
jgi:hypothetical protein